MKKNLIPILLAGAGAVIFFIMRKKKDENTPVNVEQLDETFYLTKLFGLNMKKYSHKI